MFLQQPANHQQAKSMNSWNPIYPRGNGSYKHGLRGGLGVEVVTSSISYGDVVSDSGGSGGAGIYDQYGNLRYPTTGGVSTQDYLANWQNSAPFTNASFLERNVGLLESGQNNWIWIFGGLAAALLLLGKRR